MERFITAGAGSGKTYTVTTEVANRIKADKGKPDGLRPEQVIMTTFTRAAAQELREKAKKELVNVGCPEEALQMEHALIGTVHSVASTFLTKYWYLLGIMPDACAIEEDELQVYRDQSLRGLLSPEERKSMYDYCEKYEIEYPYNKNNPQTGLNYEFWKDDLCKVLDYMQWYSITDDLLDKSMETTESIVKLLTPDDAKDLISETMNALAEAEGVLGGMRQTAKVKSQRSVISDFAGRNAFSDEELEVVSTIMKDRCKESSHGKYIESYLVSKKLLSSSVANDHRNYAKIIFKLAKQWRKDYRKFKDEHHMIDFNDMEEMFVKLLGMDEVQKDIKARYKCVYVDEFQDSNPIQVKIFKALSELIDCCYVGDKKQAIFGFRGSDTELTTAIAESIAKGSSLPCSYRSIEPLVKLSNKVFTKIFAGMTDVTLDMPKKNGNYDKEEKPLRLWQWKDDKDLATQIQQFILREKIDCKDIAVLARANSDLDKLAEELRALDVPVCRESNDIKESRTGRLVKALLTLMATPGNMMARAEVAYLTQPGYNVTEIIESRIDNLGNKEYLKDVPLLKRMYQLRNDIKSQSVSALLETLIIELDLYAVVNNWKGATAEETNLQVFVDLAKKYEDNATKMAIPATIVGFIDYFCNQKQDGAADNGGVRLYTYHKSKGLEWKVVIMLSLDEDVMDEEKIAKRCMLGCHNHRTEKPTAENLTPPMTISLVRNIYAKSPSHLPASVMSKLMQHPLWNDVCKAEKSESARLLYVGVTRARNILVLASKGEGDAINLNWFRTVGLDTVKQTVSEDAEQDILGVDVKFAIEKLDNENQLEWPETSEKKVLDIASEFSSLDNIRSLAPSKVGTKPHDLGEILNEKEDRMFIKVNDDDYASMGDFIHQVFCCMDDGITVEQIKALRADYGFTEKNMPKPEELINRWNYLTDQLSAEYGKDIRRIHERPFQQVDAQGHHISGFIDFIWETADGYVVVDYKTDGCKHALIFDPNSEHYVGRHGDQLDCYEQALEAEGGKDIKARLIYYPETKFLVEVK